MLLVSILLRGLSEELVQKLMPSDSFCIFTSGSGILGPPPQLELQLCCDLLDAKLCLDCL